jgi:Mycothiol maleylpyruvate isomerase N-terminal domain
MNDARDRRERLIAELEDARARFIAALTDVEPDLFTSPGLVGQWSARDLVEHLAFWSDHGADALELAAAGKGADFDYDSSQTDVMNAETFSASSAMTPGEVAEHEQVAFERFRDDLAELDPAVLDLTLGNGDVVEAVVRYDGPDHYAEHTEHIRAWFNGQSELDEDDQ